MKDQRGARIVRQLQRAVLAAARDAEGMDFSPFAMDVIEVHASPIKVRLLLSICAFMLLAIVGACLFRVDIHAVVPGRVQVVGRSKIIQPLDAGKVKAIFVANGSRVTQGDQLLLLDDTEVLANRREDEMHYNEYRAEIARRRAAIDGVQHGRFSAVVEFSIDIEDAIQVRERDLLQADLAELAAAINALKSKKRESLIQQAALRATISSQGALIDTLKERLDMREALQSQNWETRANVLDAAETLARERTARTDHEGQLQQAAAAARSIDDQIGETITKFISDNREALETAESKRDNARQELVKSEEKTGRSAIVAPIDGEVQELAVTTIGQVLNRGQQVMTIVPTLSPIEIEALVSNTDIGFVKVGQTAVIKIDTFPFSIYGSIGGRVSHISSDAVSASDPHQVLPTAAQIARPVGEGGDESASVPAVQNLVFPVTIIPNKAALFVNGRAARLTPGMTVSAEILTGRRRVIEFVLSPLREITSDAIHER